jgi:hypothetical protein
MKKKQFMSIFFLLMLLSQIGLSIEQQTFSNLDSVAFIRSYEQPPKIIKKINGRVTNLRVSDDFISGISHHFELSQLRMKIDAIKCKDQSVYNGIGLIESYFLDGFFEIMVNYYQKHGSASKLTNQYLNDEFNQRNLKAIKSALEYHSTHAYQLEYPYWLSNHGMNHFNMVMNNRQNSSKKDIFISALDSRKKEAQLITIFKKAAKII